MDSSYILFSGTPNPSSFCIHTLLYRVIVNSAAKLQSGCDKNWHREKKRWRGKIKLQMKYIRQKVPSPANVVLFLCWPHVCLLLCLLLCLALCPFPFLSGICHPGEFFQHLRNPRICRRHGVRHCKAGYFQFFYGFSNLRIIEQVGRNLLRVGIDFREETEPQDHHALIGNGMRSELRELNEGEM